MTSTHKTVGTSTQTNQASDLFRPATNPFLANAAASAAVPAKEGYALYATGPAVDASEVEVAHAAQVEVRIGWGETQLHVAHLDTARGFYVGEEQSKNISCDYFLPAEKLGATRAPLVYVRGGVSYAVIFQGATGFVQQGGKRSSIAELIASGGVEPCPELAGAVMVVLAAGTSLEMAHNDMTYAVASVATGRRFAAPLIGAGSLATAIMVGLSCLVHTGLLAGFAFFKPTLGGIDDDESRKEQQFLMAQILKSAADQEEPKLPEDTSAQAADSKDGGTGTRAKHEEGSMGSQTSKDTGKKYGVQGPKENPDPHIARQAAVREAAEFGIIGLLNTGAGGDPNAPTAPWGRDDSLGADDKSARGGMWGAEIGESLGAGGLGLSGIGEGGGGKGEGIGLGTIGTLGGGSGLGEGSGFGNSRGRVGGTHVAKAPSVQVGVTTVSGKLPREVIQRIVRQNYGRFRLCFENGLRTNPNLTGRVGVRFVIDREGRVANVGNGGSDLPDSAVVSCVVRSFAGLSFPAPEGGIVTVVYPIIFSPGSLASGGASVRREASLRGGAFRRS